MIPLEWTGSGGEPSVAVNRYGTLLVGWMNWTGPLSSAPPGVNEYAVSTDEGRSFSAAEPLPVTIQRYESDVAIAAGPANGTFWVGYQSQPTSCSTTSSGVTVTEAWRNATEVGSPALSMGCANNRYYDREWLGSTPNGTVFQVADVPIGLPTPDLFVARSFDGTQFQTPVLVANDSYIAVGASAYNDSLWGIGDTDYPSKQCVLYLSEDGGSSWSPTVAPLPADCSSGLDPAAAIRGVEWQFAWGPKGELIVAYVNNSGVEVVRSSNLGGTWSAPELVSGVVPAGTSYQTPTIAVNRSTGATAVAWLDTRAGNSSWEVYMTTSNGSGFAWSGPGEISGGTVGFGTKFWPGDFIGSTLTPWGTDAVVWGGFNTSGVLIPWFTQVPVVSFPVSFTERGLPAGTSWSVTLNGTRLISAGPTISFRELDGSYPFSIENPPGFASSPSAGTVRVDGPYAGLEVDFSQVSYRVTFNESGLPAGTNWSVSLGDQPAQYSTTTVIVFSVPNGTYSFSFGPVQGFVATSASGAITVAGSSVSQAVRFAPMQPTEYVVSFEAAGLPSGTVWTATLNGTSLSSASPTLLFEEPNGSYLYSVAGETGYAANDTSGRVDVNGTGKTIWIEFSTLGGGSSGPIGWNGWTPIWLVSLGAIGFGSLAAVVFMYRRRKGQGGPGGSPPNLEGRPPTPS